MIFTQLAFLVFFVAVFVIHRLMRSHRARKAFLLAASYFFYGYWDYRFLSLIFVSTSIDYLVGLRLERTENPQHRRLLVTVSLVLNLGLLGFFKYFNFMVDSAHTLLTRLGVESEPSSLEIILPVGISFFTFQSMSYTIDVYRRNLSARKSFIDFALYVSFFPQLVAGPIVRASDFLPQLETPRKAEAFDARRILLLFAIGYFKKACVADNIGAAIDPVFANPTSYAAADRILGACLYSAQIYCDFSGYTDMAIATAGAFGYTLTKNFDAPYYSSNVREFWQRWHISLSTWLRDYLYIPLGGNRGGPLRVSRNLLLTMLLGGLWHGANWTFVLWGALHGVALVVHRFFRQTANASRWIAAFEYAPWKVSSWLLTLFWVVFCFTIFRTPSLASAGEYFLGPVMSHAHADLWNGWWILSASLMLTHFLAWRKRDWLIQRAAALPDWVFFPSLGACSAILLYLTPLNFAPFIYFQF